MEIFLRDGWTFVLFEDFLLTRENFLNPSLPTHAHTHTWIRTRAKERERGMASELSGSLPLPDHHILFLSVMAEKAQSSIQQSSSWEHASFSDILSFPFLICERYFFSPAFHYSLFHINLLLLTALKWQLFLSSVSKLCKSLLKAIYSYSILRED